jgi:hypothetical protein
VPPDTTVCVDSSTNVETHGASAAGRRLCTTTAHLPDALILLVATRPKIVVMSAELGWPSMARRQPKTSIVTRPARRDAAGRILRSRRRRGGSEVLRATAPLP